MKWFKARLKSSTAIIQIAEIDRKPVGQVRLEFSTAEKSWLVDISVATEFRGKGMAAEILQKAVVALRKIQCKARVVAWVKRANENSIRVFESAGFRQTSENEVAICFVDDVFSLSSPWDREAKNS